jgi:hypothetical protein
MAALRCRERSKANYSVYQPSFLSYAHRVHEKDVALTDFALAVECAIFAVLIWQKLAASSYRRWLIVLFASISVGALCGGLTHAYFPNETTRGYEILWIATMLSIGVSALACWNLAAEVLNAKWRLLRIAAAVEFGAFAILVLAGWRAYKYVIADYVPAAIFLLIISAIAITRGARALVWVVIGLLLTFAAAAIQLLHIALPLVSHNALYHLVQAIALLLMFVGFLRHGAIHQP